MANVNQISLEAKQVVVEVWKNYPEDVRYEVSSVGRVRKNGRIKKQNYTEKKYLRTKINAKHKKVHYLVLSTFRPNTRPWFYNMVDHINGVRDDNRIENLRWSNDSLNQLMKKRKPIQPKTSGKFSAEIKVDGKHIYLGMFKTQEEAKARVDEARLDAFEVCDYNMF